MFFYERAGYHPLDVPWCVSDEAMNITRPVWAGTVNAAYIAGGKQQCPVASAEQSFLQLQLDSLAASGSLNTGTYVAITPCFRNEPVIDELHQPYFMNIELGSYGIRKHPKVGTWVYGTGCAEPRLSYAIEQDILG